MSYAWLAVAVVSAAGMGVAVQKTLAKPMPSHIVPVAPGFASEKPQNNAVVEKALVFAMVARDSGAFAGAAAWPALAGSANVPSSISSSGFPSNWSASYSGVVLTVCLLGAPKAAVDAISTKMSGVTAKNSGC
jgi:hypothetical protein